MQLPEEGLKYGQVWHYKTRPNEKDSMLYVCRVEQVAEGEARRIVHIALDGLKIKYNADVGEFISHIPVDEDNLKSSLTNFLGYAEELPPYEEGYAEWIGCNGGVYTLPVSEIVDTIEKAMQQGSAQ